MWGRPTVTSKIGILASYIRPRIILPIFCILVSLPAAAEFVSAKATEMTQMGAYDNTHGHAISAPAAVISDGDAEARWFTHMANGDYFEQGAPPPVFVLDLGDDRTLDGFAFTNAALSQNAVTAMTMRLATGTEGNTCLGATIPELHFEPSTEQAKGQAENFEDKGTGGISFQESFASPAVGDYDNDGGLDVYFTTVYGGDTAVLYRNDSERFGTNRDGVASISGADVRETRTEWAFTNVTGDAGLGGIRNTSQAAWCDFDNDGGRDLMSGGRLWRNNGNSNYWIKVKLVGTHSTSSGSATPSVNRSAIGAVVRLPHGDTTLTRQVESSTGQGNHNGHTLHFGLGGKKRDQTLEIAWPYTKQRQIVSSAANREITIESSGD